MTPTPRTYLFVPGDRPERFDKALACGADAVVLDLEDAVAVDNKSGARKAVHQRLLAATREERDRLLVRINDESAAEFGADLALLQSGLVSHVILPKAERTATFQRMRALCPEIHILALIETARGVQQAEMLAEAAGVVRLVFGTIDYALDLNLSGDPVGFDYAASRLAIASRAARLEPPVAGVTPDVADLAALLSDLERARAHGFGAKLCIHPQQVAAVHEALWPSAVELDWARRVLDAAQSQRGTFQLDGRMIDKPVLDRAKAVLSRVAR